MGVEILGVTKGLVRHCQTQNKSTSCYEYVCPFIIKELRDGGTMSKCLSRSKDQDG